MFGAAKAALCLGPYVVERARDDDVDPVFPCGTKRELLLRELADAIRVGRCNWTLFRQRCRRSGIYLRGSYDHHAARHARSAQRIEQVMRREHIRRQWRQRVTPGVRHIRRASAVDHR
jgi:hypothetical protein